MSIRLYGAFAKVDAEQRLVSGYASTEARDSSKEIVLKSAVDAALADYLEWGNVREMHQNSAVGTAEEAEIDAKGLYLTAKIVDDAAWSKVQAGVYKGFSIGGKVVARDPKDRSIITKIALHEISLVDRPSNPDAVFDLWRAAGLATSDPIQRAFAVLDSFKKAVYGESFQEAEEEALDPLQRANAAVEALVKAIAVDAPAIAEGHRDIERRLSALEKAA